MDGYDDSVMVALLPVNSDWCHLELPHLTLVYAGSKSEMQPRHFSELSKDVSSLAAMSRPLTLRVLSTEVFGGGDDPRVDVFRLVGNEQLLSMRRVLLDWNRSKHSGYRPHVTIGPEGSRPQVRPPLIGFDRLGLFWGEDSLVFNLR